MLALSGQVTVFSDKANPLRRKRAVTLIEAVLDAVSQDDVTSR